MRNVLITFFISLTLAIGLFGGAALAQQTAAKTAQRAPVTATKKTTTAKRTPATTKPKAVALTTKQDKISYALGMNMAKTLQRQSLEVEPDVLVKGLKDVLTGSKTLLSEDEAHDNFDNAAK